MSRRSRKRNSWKRMGSWEGRLRSRISKTEARLTMQVAKSGLANGIKDANRMVRAATKKIVRRGKYGGRLDAKTVMAQIRKDLHVGGRKRMRRNPFERNLSHHAHVSRATGMIPMPYDRLEAGDAGCSKGYTRLGFSRVCAPKKSSRQARAEMYNEDWAEQAMTPNRGRKIREWRDYGLGRTDSIGGKKVVRTPLGRPCPKGYKRLPGMRACVEVRGGKKGRKRKGKRALRRNGPDDRRFGLIPGEGAGDGIPRGWGKPIEGPPGYVMSDAERQMRESLFDPHMELIPPKSDRFGRIPREPGEYEPNYRRGGLAESAATLIMRKEGLSYKAALKKARKTIRKMPGKPTAKAVAAEAGPHHSKAPLGSGERFRSLVRRLMAEGKTEKQAKGLAAMIGRRKYGAKYFNSLAQMGRKRKRR